MENGYIVRKNENRSKMGEQCVRMLRDNRETGDNKDERGMDNE